MNYTGQRILVLGLGMTGLSLALWLRGRGTDVASPAPAIIHQLAALRKRADGIPVILGPWKEALFRGIDMVAISPGININTPLIAGARARACRSSGTSGCSPANSAVAAGDRHHQLERKVDGDGAGRRVTLGPACAPYRGHIGIRCSRRCAMRRSASDIPRYMSSSCQLQLETTTNLMPVAISSTCRRTTSTGIRISTRTSRSCASSERRRAVLNRDDPMTMAMQISAIARTFGDSARA
jgi:hypothetical protein